MKPLFTVIILTFNEERNIKDCLESIKGLPAEIHIVDSGSTDRTLEICSGYPLNIHHHPFINYGAQRNWALQQLPVKGKWIVNMDADHRLSPELITALREAAIAPENETISGFLVSRRTMFLGKWIKYGGQYPTYQAAIFRRGTGYCEDKLYDQHFVVRGKTKILRGDIIDIITDSLQTFTNRHNHWATLEADEQLQLNGTAQLYSLQPYIFGNKMAQRRSLKRLYERFPLFVRPFLYFGIRYFLKLGFLDGRRGLIFHFLQGFWFRFLIDAKIYEKRQLLNTDKKNATNRSLQL